MVQSMASSHLLIATCPRRSSLSASICFQIKLSLGPVASLLKNDMQHMGLLEFDYTGHGCPPHAVVMAGVFVQVGPPAQPSAQLRVSARVCCKHLTFVMPHARCLPWPTAAFLPCAQHGCLHAKARLLRHFHSERKRIRGTTQQRPSCSPSIGIPPRIPLPQRPHSCLANRHRTCRRRLCTHAAH